MIYVFLATGFEDIEALAPVDIMRRAGLPVETVSVTAELKNVEIKIGDFVYFFNFYFAFSTRIVIYLYTNIIYVFIYTRKGGKIYDQISDASCFSNCWAIDGR